MTHSRARQNRDERAARCEANTMARRTARARQSQGERADTRQADTMVRRTARARRSQGERADTREANTLARRTARARPTQQQASTSDRPDLTCRIFRAKLTHLVDALRRGLLGQKVYLMYVVEFQKRGLPHAHLAFRVTPRPHTSDEIDDIV